MPLLVGVGPLAAIGEEVWTQLRLEGLERVSVHDPLELLKRLEDDLDEVTVVLVDAGFEDPLTITQAVSRADATIEILFLETSERDADRILSRAVSPFLGPQVRSLDPSISERVVEHVWAASSRTRLRREEAARRAAAPPAGPPRDAPEPKPLFADAPTDEQRYRRSQQFLESVIEHVPDMIFVKEAQELRFVHFNRAGEELLGFARAQMHGRNDYDFFPPEEASFFTAKDRQVLAGRSMVEVPEEPIQTKHRGMRWLHTRKVPVFDENGEPLYLVGISQDITEAKQAREELARVASELARSNRELEDFAYVASHDLQEPLRKIRTFGERLGLTAADKLDADEAHMLERMQDAAARMQRLIDDLLAYSRVTRTEGDLVPVALDDVLADVAEDLRQPLEESGGRLDVGPLPVVMGREVQAHQLFQNLVGNAIKFTRPGEPPEVSVRSEPAGDGRVRVVVEDRGIGFDMRQRDRMFSPFQRLVTREAYPGTGMGLAICGRIVEQFGGRIDVQSEPDGGARFAVELSAPGSPGA